MGNVHSLIQVVPRYFEGAAIEIRRSAWKRLARLHADRPHPDPNVLIKTLASGKQLIVFAAGFPRSVAGFMMREVQMVPYAAFPDVRPEGMDRDNPALAGLPGV